ncbi:MAG TPA: hypothetical protein DGR97_08905 [Gammaproteobacteria bacterium]|nr:hypothetical protein [Gammaproteobacteria bacterium]|tara:strand:- start:503 stop:1726 length:1224 start_codon:yes stop_codon:yes gene_type:complete
MMGRQHYDIVVVGAGLVGLSVSMLLEKLGYRIALVDPKTQPAPLSEKFDHRTYAISPASMRLFDRLGVYDAMDRSRITEFFDMQVWDANSNGTVQFSAHELGRDRLGWIVEHSNLMIALTEALFTLDNVDRITGSVNAIEQDESIVGLILDNGEQLRAPLVLGCDGANSRVRSLLNMSAKVRDYVQHSILCNVEIELPHAQTARQRFLTTGPLAFLPLPNPHECSIIWSTTREQASQVVKASDSDFHSILGAAFEHRLGAIQSSGKRLVVPLQALHTKQYISGRTALLGDAAHVVHPLAGQGLNLGLMDAAALAQVLGSREDMTLRFLLNKLRRYERMRRGENLAMLKLTEELNQLFCDDHSLTRCLRGTGMQFVDRMTPIKKWLMLRAMGDVGDVPIIASYQSELK